MNATRANYKGKGKFASIAQILNEHAHLINTMTGDNGIEISYHGGKIHIRQAAASAGSRVTAFEVISVGNDSLVCARVKEVNPDTGMPVAKDVPAGQDEETHSIMLPWLLRRTPFDGQTVSGIEYTYTSPTERTAKEVVDEGEPAEEEIQLLTPDYLVREVEGGAIVRAGELIYAVQSIEGWVDTNHAGRCWAAIEDDDEEEVV